MPCSDPRTSPEQHSRASGMVVVSRPRTEIRENCPCPSPEQSRRAVSGGMEVGEQAG